MANIELIFWKKKIGKGVETMGWRFVFYTYEDIPVPWGPDTGTGGRLGS